MQVRQAPGKYLREAGRIDQAGVLTGPWGRKAMLAGGVTAQAKTGERSAAAWARPGFR